MHDEQQKCENPAPSTTHVAAMTDALRCLEGKWKIRILYQLFSTDVLRFSELERRIEGVTQKMLIQQLKELEKDGLVRRIVYPQVPPKVEYSLTKVGYALAPAIGDLMEWAELRQSGDAT
jgi:DNA-binding HxlR family transcriptional regulator